MEQRRELVSIVDEETERLSALVSEAIQMARIEAGRVQLRRENHSLRDLIGTVLKKIKPALERRTIQVTVASEVPHVLVDGELIELVLRQLLDNALKYSPPDSPISIAVATSSGRVQVSVADRGPGIPESEQGRIFEKFYRAESSRQQIPGAGLGLAVAREIIHAHGGEIWVESEPSHGSIFHVSLPIVAAPAVVRQAS